MPRDDGVSLDVVRAAARERVESTSLRPIAAEIGIAHQALHRFIHGGQPYGKTAGKLRAWYGDDTNELLRLRRENAELRRRLAECERLRGGA